LELLPPDFYEAIAANRKDRGGLKYSTKEMFDLFIIVEQAYQEEVPFVLRKKISKLLHNKFIIGDIINSYTASHTTSTINFALLNRLT
jgi:hypothetical protein